MLQLFVNGEGGLTAAGYGLCALLLVLSILAGLFLAEYVLSLPPGSWPIAPWPWPWPM